MYVINVEMEDGAVEGEDEDEAAEDEVVEGEAVDALQTAVIVTTTTTTTTMTNPQTVDMRVSNPHRTLLPTVLGMPTLTLWWREWQTYQCRRKSWVEVFIILKCSRASSKTGVEEMGVRREI